MVAVVPVWLPAAAVGYNGCTNVVPKGCGWAIPAPIGGFNPVDWGVIPILEALSASSFCISAINRLISSCSDIVFHLLCVGDSANRYTPIC